MEHLLIDLMDNPESFKEKAKSEGLDINAKDQNGKTILHHLTGMFNDASSEMKEDLSLAIKAVLDLGAAPHIVDNSRKAAGEYIEQTEEHNSVLKMIYDAQRKFNPIRYQEEYSAIKDDVKADTTWKSRINGGPSNKGNNRYL